MKKFLTAGLSLLCALALLPLPASANSAQTQWRGTDAAGAMVTEETCPLTVEHERLRFALAEFPESYYAETADFLAYSGSVTAEYTFYNPADYAVSATLVFPFGAVPDYGDTYDPETGEHRYDADTDKYLVTMNGTAVERTLRHTYFPYGAQFDRARDMALLHDGFQPDAFYSPDMTVTRYTYLPSGVDTDAYPAATAAFECSADDSQTKLLAENSCGGELLDDGIRLDFWVKRNDGLVLDVIGKLPEEAPQWKFYENGACETEIDGTMTLVSTEAMTLRELALSRYDEGSGILEHDWYNAFITQLNEAEWTFGVINGCEVSFDLTGQLMRWYEYELTLAPNERVLNAVTAPMYPAINEGYDPPVYTYTYLLSPAQSWAAFGDLDIAVETPFYLTQSSLSGFTKTDGGYALHMDSLPSGELTFALSAEQAPTQEHALSDGTWMLLLAALAALLAAVLFICRHISKKRKAE